MLFDELTIQKRIYKKDVWYMTRQHPADQDIVIKSNEWLLKVEMEEIKRNTELENGDIDIE